MKRKALTLGGGVVGVAAFMALVRRGAADLIEIVNPGPLGLAIAFARTESALLTNTPVDALSIIADDTDDFLHDFLHYLYSREVSAIMTSFLDQPKLSIRAGSPKRVDAPIKVGFLHGPVAILKLLTPRFVRLKGQCDCVVSCAGNIIDKR
jgi:threonine dehydrogenase-like Zn-dependent dehydrogenase